MNRIAFWLLAAGLLLSMNQLFGGEATAASSDNQGFIYGRVMTESGSEYTGFLRWGTEEAFWDDLFHSSKDELPYREYVDPDELDHPSRRRGGTVSILMGLIRWETDEGEWSTDRIFVSRFGDIARIVVTGEESAKVFMKSGAVHSVSGYANDVGGTIFVRDTSFGEIDLHWDRIDQIDFLPTPLNEDPLAYRLHGRVETDSGEFSGFIQWDKQECLSTDELDGETRDGDVAIKMGRIRSIERRGSGARVALKDGRKFRLRDSNDVNDQNRGIMVEDSRYGRLTVPWDEFDRITFSDPGSSGRGYEDFATRGELTGVVSDHAGQLHQGRIVIDLDESAAWEILNGSALEIDYDIPLANVVAIAPHDDGESLVTLQSGEQIEFDAGQDVTGKNDGVLIFTNTDDPTYLKWEDIAEIRFDHHR